MINDLLAGYVLAFGLNPVAIIFFMGKKGITGPKFEIKNMTEPPAVEIRPGFI